MWDKITKPAEEPPYRPLAEYHIRVAKIKPGTTEYPLRVKLQHVDPRNTKYIALSYTWDQDPSLMTGTATNSSEDSPSPPARPSSSSDPQITRHVLCGGTPFRVRQNLYDALCQMRDVQSDVPVFVDALCINFSDNSERARYLEIMGHVYSRAASVVVYLGPKSPSTDDTLLIMRKFVNAINWRRMAEAEPSAHYNFRDPRFFQNMGMEPLTVKQWRQIHDLCHMYWFTRYWAFFELALAKNPLFLWGEACMEYNFLIDFGMILTLSGWLEDIRQVSTEYLNVDDTDSSVGLTKMLGPVARLRSSPPWSPKNKDYSQWMQENYNISSEQGQAWMFFEILLRSAEAFECRDPRDRVYAPLTLARAAFGGKPMNKLWPRPDYSKPAEVVLREFADIIERETGQRSVLATEIGMDTNPNPNPGPVEEQDRRSRPRMPFR